MAKECITIIETRANFRYGMGCGGMCWDWDGAFKAETSEGVLYFFYTTVEDVMGVTKDDLFAVHFPSPECDEEPNWIELYSDGTSDLDSGRIEDSRYYSVFLRLQDFVKSMPTQIDIEAKPKAAAKARKRARMDRSK